MATQRLPPVQHRLDELARGGGLGPGDLVRPLPPGLFGPDLVGNLFDRARPGLPVVRPDDLLAARIELRNLEVVPGSPPRVRHAGLGPAWLALHLPPQSLAEEAFHELPASGTDAAKPDRPPPVPGVPEPPTPPGEGPVDPSPLRARAAGESRIVFDWPEGFEADYTLAGLLAAVQQLSLRVPAAALPRQAGRRIIPWWPGALLAEEAGRLAVRRRNTVAGRALALGAISLRQAQIALRGGSGAEATLARRLLDVQPNLSLDAARGVAFDAAVRPLLPRGPLPALPGPAETALELPWRLIIAPHAGERWRHASGPATLEGTRRTELWHTRLVGSDAAGAQAIEPPRADAQRTVRAVWATTSDTWGQPMQGAFPAPMLPAIPLPGVGDPFLTTLNDYDRYQISHLSANFGTSYRPQPIDVKLLMLSALGGWLDSRGAWDPPGLDVEEWVHRASMGRDHYVRVVYRGLLFPLGHRAVLIKVTERKFHPALPGNPAVLRQRFFMVVRERERRYDDAGSLQPYGPGNQRVNNEFPFTHVRIVTETTPDLAAPALTQVAGLGQMMFWPAVGAGAEPFRFRIRATELDGRVVEFALPMIFMSNALASPRVRASDGRTLLPLYSGSAPGLQGAAEWANTALAGWNATQTPEGIEVPDPGDRTVAAMGRQRVALAPSIKPGDTSIEAVSLTFGAHVPTLGNAASVNAFAAYSQRLSRPMFFPRVVRAQARNAALSQLSGNERLNVLRWNDTYARLGFAQAGNKGEVFVDVASFPQMAQLDFSKQGDRSGGFVMPNMSPSALSRAIGPAAGPVADLLAGRVVPTGFFPPGGVGSLPLPLLFGCIPLSAVIEQVDDLLGQLDKVPRFASEASTKVESFFAELARLYGLVSALAEQPARLADAALAVARATLADLAAQALAFAPADAAMVASRAAAVQARIDTLAAQLATLATRRFDDGDPLAGIDLSVALDAPAGNGQLRQALEQLRDAVAAAPGLPAGFRQGVNQAVAGALAVLGGLAAFAGLYASGKVLFDALKDLLDNPAPGQALGELITRPGDLAPKVQAVADALGAVRDGVAALPLLEGAGRQALLGALDAVQQMLGAVPDLLALLENLLGEELVIRFDWKPLIRSWGFTAADPLFVVHDRHGFIVAVEARVKKSGGAPKVKVLCGLKHFDLVLIAPAGFIELNFEKIEFSVDSAAKMNVDVLLTDIKFIGPLSFVETLRDLIPLDGFSDPPALDITPQGIDASFQAALPSLSCGVLNLSNLSLGAGFTVPFIGQPLSVRFNFCTREQPFCLTVYMFGGGGFFGVTIDPKGVQILEAAFEFGAAISVDFGVASGGVSVMAGIYFRMEQSAASLTGYFRLEGHVDVLGIITASLELYLELRYEFETGKCVGRAQLTIEISVFIFSGSVTISCERKFAGSSGDPTMRQIMGLSADPALPLADELAAIDDTTAYAWRDYCEAFA